MASPHPPPAYLRADSQQSTNALGYARRNPGQVIQTTPTPSSFPALPASMRKPSQSSDESIREPKVTPGMPSIPKAWQLGGSRSCRSGDKKTRTKPNPKPKAKSTAAKKKPVGTKRK